MKQFAYLALTLLISAPLFAMKAPATDKGKEDTEAINSAASTSAPLPGFPSNSSLPLPPSISSLATQFANRESIHATDHARPVYMQNRFNFQNREAGSAERSESRPPFAQVPRSTPFDATPPASTRNPLFNSPELSLPMELLSTMVLIPGHRQESPLEKLKQNANEIHDTLVKISPIFLSWLKQPAIAIEVKGVYNLNSSLRTYADTHDSLLTPDIKKTFAPTQSFQRLYVIASLLDKARLECKDTAASQRQGYLLNHPEHDMSTFERIFTPLYASIEDIKNSTTIRQSND